MIEAIHVLTLEDFKHMHVGLNLRPNLMPECIVGILLLSRWFLFEKVIEALVAKQIYHRNVQQLEHYARKECFMEDVKEFDSMISFYHGLGMIIKHRSTVVLKAQWLIDLFKQLITIPPFNKQVENKFLF